MLPVTAFEAPHSFDFKEIYIIVLEGSRRYTSVLMGEIKHRKYFSSPSGKTPTLILLERNKLLTPCGGFGTLILVVPWINNLAHRSEVQDLRAVSSVWLAQSSVWTLAPVRSHCHVPSSTPKAFILSGVLHTKEQSHCISPVLWFSWFPWRTISYLPYGRISNTRFPITWH